MKILYFFLIISFILSNNTFANTNKKISSISGCNSGVNEENFINSQSTIIKNIEVDVHNYRRWTVNGVRILTSRYRYTEDEYKRRFDATITVNFNDNSKCIFFGKARHSGDEKDHIGLTENSNSIIQSLDIHLDHGNIKGITKFKLLRANTRGKLEDEIFSSEILRVLGYLSPRTFRVNARINLANSVMIMQEKAAKELLEYNRRREGPILEADERFFWKTLEKIPNNQLSGWSAGVVPLTDQAAKYMLAKQLNPSIINKSDLQKTMSFEALTKLNLIYLYYSNRFQDGKNNYHHFEYDLDNNLLGLFDKKNVLKLDAYNLFQQAINGQHGLASNNRKFYWNPIERYFEPINYDTNSNLDRNFNADYYRLPISENFPKAFDYLEDKIKKIDLEKLSKNINNAGVNLNPDQINNKIEKVKKNLSLLKKSYLNVYNTEIFNHNKFFPKDDITQQLSQNLKEIEPRAYLVKNNISKSNFQRCDINLDNCEDYYFSQKNLSDLLEGELVLNDRPYQYIGQELDINKVNNTKKIKKMVFEKSKIFYEEGIKIESDINSKILNITQTKPGSKLFIIDGELNNLIINFKGYEIIENSPTFSLKTFPPNYPINDLGLTGCLSLVNLKVENISINANKSSCEDTVNLININGSIKEVIINDSFSDGLDVDFSNLEIHSIKISSSLNDCSDFSGGNYKLNYLQLKNCGDKGLSVGEKSVIKLNDIFVENANIGIASKDSSVVRLKKANLKNLKTCVSAYNKKQEFSGGIIKVENLECKNYFRKADIDYMSKIFEKNKNILNDNYGSTYDLSELKISEVKGKPVIKNFHKDYKTFHQDKSINAVIEIPAGVNEKWEVSKQTGSLNREFYMGKPRMIQHEAYPINYGMIPRTVLPTRIGGDGDPLDILVLGPPLVQGDVVQVKIIGLMKMTDFGERDDKIIGVPINSDLAKFENLLHLKSSHPELIEEIKVWFENYKGKNVVKFKDFGSTEDAQQLVYITNRYYERFGLKPRS